MKMEWRWPLAAVATAVASYFLAVVAPTLCVLYFYLPWVVLALGGLHQLYGMWRRREKQRLRPGIFLVGERSPTTSCGAFYCGPDEDAIWEYVGADFEWQLQVAKLVKQVLKERSDWDNLTSFGQKRVRKHVSTVMRTAENAHDRTFSELRNRARVYADNGETTNIKRCAHPDMPRLHTPTHRKRRAAQGDEPGSLHRRAYRVCHPLHHDGLLQAAQGLPDSRERQPVPHLRRVVHLRRPHGPRALLPQPLLAPRHVWAPDMRRLLVPVRRGRALRVPEVRGYVRRLRLLGAQGRGSRAGVHAAACGLLHPRSAALA